MNLIRKYNKLKNVPSKILDAYKDGRYSVVIPDTRDFRIESIDWVHVDWINYIAMRGRMWNKSGSRLKI